MLRTSSLLPLIFLLVASAAAQKPWQQRELMIGTYYDPPYVGVEDAAERTRQWQLAREAGFNFVLDNRIEHGYTPRDDRDAARNAAREAGFEVLLTDNSLRAKVGESVLKARMKALTADGGIYYADEPREADLDRVRTAARAAREACPQRLFFVNLLPVQGFTSWEAFERYARSYADEQTALPVLCFDNYHPATHFAVSPDQPGYFSNLALMRQLSGERPLWSYIKTRSNVARRDPNSQRAFLWLSAFAPMAYGAKGLLYFTYDRYETGDIRRDFDYRTKPGWNQRLYAELPGEPAQKFLCRLRDNAYGYADLALYSPEEGGTWSVKYAKADRSETTKRCDWTRGGVGEGIPFTGDIDSDGLDELLLLRADATLLVLSPQGDGKQSLTLKLSSFPFPKFPDTSRQQPAIGAGPGAIPVVADFDGNGKADLAVQSDKTTYVFWDYQPARKNFAARTEAGGRYIVQLIGHEDRLYGLEETYLYELSRTAGWHRLRELKKPAAAGRIDHFWMEGQLLLAQDAAGRIWCERRPDGDLSEEMASHKENFLYKLTLKNYRTGRYDLYGILLPRYDYNALLDTRRRPTSQYYAASAANNYVRQTLAPIVMNERWEGAYFANVPRGERVDLVQTVGRKTPVLRSSQDGLLVGVFSKDARTAHLLCVNLTDKPLRPTISAAAKTARLLPMMPADGGTAREPLATTSKGTLLALTLPTLRGGECAVIEVGL